jgi:curved DNA-binding protein CbpA
MLGASEGASFKELKEHYHSKSKVYHPDVSPNTLEIYQNIQLAYKILATPDTRKKYDLSLGIQNSPWEKELMGSKF